MIAMNPNTEATMLQAVQMSELKNPANDKPIEYPISLQSIAENEMIPSARTGEKSIIPILRKPFLEKKSRYGSVMLLINLVKPLSSPGSHESTILIEQMNEYIQSTDAKNLKANNTYSI